MQTQDQWSDIPPPPGNDSTPTVGNAMKSACLHCRTKKIRCTASQVAGVCERCYRMDQDCVLRARLQRRPTRKVTLRIEELEQRLAMVTQQLQCQGQEAPIMHSPVSTTSNINSVPALRALLQSHSSSKTTQQDVFDRGLLSLDYGIALLQEYQTLSKGFAFVATPDIHSLPAMRQKSPMTLLAVLAVASWQERDAQCRLYRELWQVMSQRLFIDGELCLDILQALIILAAWNHLNLVSTYRLTVYASSIIIGLGIDSVPRDESDSAGLNLKFYPTVQTEGVKQRSSEAKRSYVGCYAVAASYALLTRKPFQLRYTPYLEQCAASLSDTATDDSLIHYVRILHHAEEIYDAFGYAESRTTAQYSDEVLRILLRTYDTRLKHLKDALPTHILVRPEFVVMMHAIGAYTHEIALYCLPPLHEQLSPCLAEIFLQCLVNIKEVLDHTILLSDRDMMSLTGYSWGRIHYDITLAYRLTFKIRSSSWDLSHVRSIVKLEDYIDLLIQRLEPIGKCVSGSEEHGNWYTICVKEWQCIRDNYTAELKQKDNKAPHVVSAQQDTAPWSQAGLAYNDTAFFDFMPNPQQWLWARPVTGPP